MAPLKILIAGGGCAGPALAFWLSRAGHHITIIERFPALRATGAQIDLRAQGIEVVRRMGLRDTIRSKCVDEAGVAFVDANGTVRGTVMANKSGKGAQSLTSEYEIMRGDVVRILYDATREGVEYLFGKTVERLDEGEDDGVIVYFSDGSEGRYDMLVGADGQGSRVRKGMMPVDGPDPYRRLGIHMAYWFIPREADDSNIRRTYLSPGGRMIFRRSHNETETQVYFILRDDSKELSSIPRASVEQQKEFWAHRFKDAGWQTGRFIEGMERTKNWFCQEVVQVRLNDWHKGRVVLLGDAAYCPSPFSGMGLTGSLVGAYVLAGEISKNAEDLKSAFENYERTMRPFVEEIQKVNVSFFRFAMPNTAWAVWLVMFIAQVICWLRIPEIKARFSKEENSGWQIPRYAELESHVQSSSG